MGKSNTRMLMRFAALAMVLTAATMIEEVKSIPLCNVDTNDLENCRAAVSGDNPPQPTPNCCAVVQVADLECLCKYKPLLSAYGFNPTKVGAVLNSCGATTPSCYRA